MKKLELKVGEKMGNLKCEIAIPGDFDKLMKERLICDIEGVGAGELTFSAYKIAQGEVRVDEVIRLWDDESIENFIRIAKLYKMKLDLRKDKRDGRYVAQFGFKITREQRDLIASAIIEAYTQVVEKQADIEGIKIEFIQKVSNYDWPTLPLNEWELNEKVCQYLMMKLKPVRMAYSQGLLQSKIRKYLEERNMLSERKRVFKGWTEVELTDYCATLTKAEVDEMLTYFYEERNEKTLKEIEQLQNLSDEEFVKKFFISQVHIDELGYFSNCPAYCDDCFWYEHFVYDLTPKEILKQAETFVVKSKSGRSYTYYKPNARLIEELSKSEVIQKLRQEKIAALQKKLI